jgi:hypothetical protein
VLTQEFIIELKKAADLFDWTLTPGTGRFAERRTVPRLQIRGRLKDRKDLDFEPIGALCFARTNMEFGEEYWVESALSIGLPVKDARDILAASNDMTWRTVEDHREPDPYKLALRKWLLEATGLHTSAALQPTPANV